MENKRLIPAYYDEKSATKTYITNTTKETDIVKINRELHNYLDNINIKSVVKDFITKILNNERLLNKVVLVTDMSYRNCAIVIKNDRIIVSHTGGYSSINPKYTYSELLKYFTDKAEKVFILLENNMPKIDIAWTSFIDNPYKDATNYLFGIDVASDSYTNSNKYTTNKITDNELNMAMLKGELSAINDKINECLDSSLNINNDCEEKKQFYKTMFNNLCRERDKIKNKLKLTKER